MLGTGASAQAAQHGTVVVPRARGSVLATYARLRAAGLRVSLPAGFLFNSLSPPDVRREVPAAGKRVARGSIVTLYLSPAPGGPSAGGPHRTSYVVPRFVGSAVSSAYAWVRSRRLAFQAYLGPLKGGGAGGLLDNYRVNRQRPTMGGRLGGAQGKKKGSARASARPAPLTVWGAQSPPMAQTGAAKGIWLAGATLTGTLQPRGLATRYYFAYGQSRAYGAQTQAQQAGWWQSRVSATAPLSGLLPATVYHYRLVAMNGAGITYGPDRTFETGGYYQNPLYSAAAMPDPFVLDNGGTHSDYWAFATGDLFPLLHSSDLVHWSARGTAMRSRPAWVTTAPDWHPWGPSVIPSSAPCPGAASGGCYIMYYVGLSAQQGVNCIGVATSRSPGGPYTDQGPLQLAGSSGSGTPLGCGDASGRGNIDPSPFIDASGRPYLYVSSDFSCDGGSCTLKPTISVIPLTADLLHAAGARVPLLSGSPGTWEAAQVSAPTVEGPSVQLHNGTYYLLYSGGSWRGDYAMGYATAASPTGPFKKAPQNPIFSKAPPVLGPGGGDAVVTGPRGGWWMLYAARQSSYDAPRTLRLDPFGWRPGGPGAPDVPVIGGPTSTPQATQP